MCQSTLNVGPERCRKLSEDASPLAQPQPLPQGHFEEKTAFAYASLRLIPLEQGLLLPIMATEASIVNYLRGKAFSTADCSWSFGLLKLC
jgi:hypothetical protein